MTNDKGNSSNFTLGISLNKPHVLLPGELDWWINMQSNYIKTQDYECWKIIEFGDKKVDPKIEKTKWGPKEFAAMEKNFKARQLIMNGLTRKDVDKVMSVATAKDMWAAIKAMHTGSENMVNNRKFDLQREFNAFKMGEDETVSDYHSRF